MVLSSGGVLYSICANMETGSGNIDAEYRFDISGQQKPTIIHKLDQTNSTNSVIIGYSDGSISLLQNFEKFENLVGPGSRVANFNSLIHNQTIHLFFSRVSNLEFISFSIQNRNVKFNESSRKQFETKSLPFICIR